MKKVNSTKMFLWLVMIVGVSLITGCAQSNSDTNDPADPTQPTVISTVPIDLTTDVATNGTISATCSEAMDSSTIIAANFTVMDGPVPVAGTVTYDPSNKTASFASTGYLNANTSYIVTLTTGAKDLGGNALAADVVWHFTTGALPDTTKPTVHSTVPDDTSTDVSVTDTIIATFSEGMDPSTIVAAHFMVSDGVTPIAGKVIYDVANKAAIFSPSNRLNNDTIYTATVTMGVKDLSGNTLNANKVWTFTTASKGLGPMPVKLGTAGNFVILAKTAITNVPTSEITGDIGLSPAAESYITGFSQTKHTGYSTSPQVTGFIFAADMTSPTPIKMTTAISDMETAYTDAAGRPTPDFVNLSSGNIGGKTLTPGLYKWGSAVTIPSDVIISGGANDVWIFQISGGLIVSDAVNVTLIGGAKAKNIFWQVAGEVTMGANSHFEGVILCQTAINVQTNATMNGRALAQSQVTLQQNIIAKPAP